MSNLGLLEEINYYKQFKTFDTTTKNKINKNDFYVAKIEKENGNNEYVFLTKDGFEEVQKGEGKKELIVPLLDRRRERWVVYCAGGSGAGKGIFISDLAVQYHQVYPNNKVYYICQSNINNDVNFSKLTGFIKQISIDNFIGKTEEQILNALSNSLLILDDNDNLEEEQRHALQNLQKTVLFLGRKFKISFYKISHYKTDSHNTRSLIHEIDYYITFVNRDLKNDRLLKDYKKITKKDLNDLSTSLWAFFDFKYEYVITNKKIFFLS